jgi:hypothetical protein
MVGYGFRQDHMRQHQELAAYLNLSLMAAYILLPINLCITPFMATTFYIFYF